jgi:hypothetical protein
VPDLTADIRVLADAYLRKLDELHDDYVYTRRLWRSLQVQVLRHGRKLSIENPVTRSKVDGMQLAAKARDAVARLRNRTFKDLVAQFELFVAELLRAWLATYPDLLSKKAINVATLLASQNLAQVQAAAVREAVESTIMDKMYGRPEKWFNYLKEVLDVRFAAADEASFVEMKARRDVLEHNGGIVEAAYLEKAKAAARHRLGDRIQLADPDVDETLRVTSQLISQVAVSAITKLKSP